MTDRQPADDSALTRWRDRRRAKRQEALEREFHQDERLDPSTRAYSNLRGLFAIPLPLLMIVSALGNWEWGPLRHDWVFFGCVLVIGAACLLLSRYYNEHYGRATLSTRQQVKAAVVVIISGPIVFGGSLLARSRADWSLDLPVNPTAATFALLMLAWYATIVGLKAHHVIIWGALLVAGALPVWNGADPSNIGLVLAGVAVMATGVFDHRLLVRTFGSPKGLNLENSNAGT